MLFSRLQVGAALAVMAVALVLAAYQTVRINGFLWWDGLLAKAEKSDGYKRALDDLAKQSKEQQKRVGKAVEQGKERIVYVERKASELERKPLPGNCVTPDREAWEKLL